LLPAYCAGWETENELYGTTRNPYDLTRSVASSSGGAAAIIAAGGSPVGLGSDVGGSIRRSQAISRWMGVTETRGDGKYFTGFLLGGYRIQIRMTSRRPCAIKTLLARMEEHHDRFY